MAASNPATAAQRRAGLASSRLPSSIARPPTVIDGSNDGVALVAVPKSASQYIPAASTGGAISMDVVVISSPSSRTNDTSPGMPPLVTHTFLVVPIHDTPDPPLSVTGVPPASNLVRTEQRISINDKELVEFDKHNPHLLWIYGTGVMPDQAHLKGQDKRKADRGKYPDCKLPIARGCPVELQTNSVSKLDGAKELNVGDVLQLSSVNYKIDHSKDKNGVMVRYDNLHAGNIKRIGTWIDVPHMHNDIFFTLFAILPHYMPNFPTLVVNKNFNPEAEAAKANDAAQRERAAAHGYEYTPAVSQPSTEVQKLKKASEKSKMIEASLTEASRSALRHFPCVIPKYVPCPAMENYLAVHGIKHWKKWENADTSNMLLEPAHMESYNFDATDANKDATTDATRKDLSYSEARDGKVFKFVPRLRYAMCVKQALPEQPEPWEKLDAEGHPKRAADGAQNVIVSVSNTGPGLYAFGTAEPELMGHVAPVLYSAMPSINMCYVSNKERVVSSSEAVINSPDERLEYLLGGVVKVSDWKGKGSQPAATRNAVSFFGDLAAGVVSRGYAIDTATAEKFIKIKQGLPGVGKTRVSDNMAHSTTVNPFADENPIGKKNVRSPVQNLFETGISFKDEKDDFQVYLVSNWALKDFIRFPQLEALYNAMRVLKADGKVDEKATMDRAVKFHSKLMLDIAEKRFPKPMSKKERLEEPTAGITFEEQVGAYSEKLREYAGLPKDVAFPIPAVDIPEVFGPLHLLTEENDSDSPTNRPFKFMLMAIRHEYLRDRRMANYIGDNWYFDVLYELYGASYNKVVESIDAGTTLPYSRWLVEGAEIAAKSSGKDVEMRDAAVSTKRKDPPVNTALPKAPPMSSPSKATTAAQPPAKVAKAVVVPATPADPLVGDEGGF